MKTNKQRTDSILKKTEGKRAFRRRVTAIATTVCAGVAATVFALVLFLPYPPAASPIAKYENSDYYSVIQLLHSYTYKSDSPTYKNNFEKWTSAVKNAFAGLQNLGTGGVKGDMMAGANSTQDWLEWEEEEAYPPTADGAAGEANGAGDVYVETTDNQVQGVIEGDLIKRTNTHIFYLSPKGGLNGGHLLRVYSIKGEASELVSEYEMPSPQGTYLYSETEMYLSLDGERITVIGSCYRSDKTARRYTFATQLDVSDPYDVKEIETTYVAGQLQSSRYTDGSLFIVNNFSVSVSGSMDFDDEASYLPQFGKWGKMQGVAAEDIVCPETLTSAKYTVICRMAEDGLTWQGCTALLSYSDEAYASESNFFIARGYSELEDSAEGKRERVSKTEIACVSYADNGLRYVGSATVCGTVKNQYSMDEYENVLRVVTTTNVTKMHEYVQGEKSYWISDGTTTNAALYCIDLWNFGVIATVENFAPDGETVESVRFDGNKAYVCTAEVVTLTDPVYAFDLSDLDNITYVETGKIEGYSSSLVNYKDGYLLGVGYGENRELKLEIYKKAGDEMEIVCSYTVQASFSEDYKSYFIDRENGFIGLGMIAWNGGSQYCLFLFDGYEIQPVVCEELQGTPVYMRAVLIDGYLYMLGGEFKVVRVL